MGKLMIGKSICIYFIVILATISGFFFAVVKPDNIGFYSFIAVASLGGLGVAIYIFNTKRKGRELVCPMGSNCNAVVTSRYSEFAGVKLEYLGMLYFTAIFFSYMALIFTPQILTGWMVSTIVLLTVGAALFSGYLLFVQAFLLRQWCIWCLLVSFLSLSIFVVSLISLNRIVEFLAEIQTFLEAMTFFGFALGLGGSTVAVFLFYKFLQDLSIDDPELNTLKGVSELIWVGFGLVLISQLATYVANSEVLSQSGVFLSRLISLFVLGAVGAVLMIIFAPFLSIIPFKTEKGADKNLSEDSASGQKEKPSMLTSLRRPIFITGAIALSSWYFAFLTKYITVNYNIYTMLTIYTVVVFVAILIALIWEWRIRRKISL